VAAGDPRQKHAGAGFGQGSSSERWNAILDFLLKFQQQYGSGQAPEPPAVGQLKERYSNRGNMINTKKPIFNKVDCIRVYVDDL
jgi:hypothetical protein